MTYYDMISYHIISHLMYVWSVMVSWSPSTVCSFHLQVGHWCFLANPMLSLHLIWPTATIARQTSYSMCRANLNRINVHLFGTIWYSTTLYPPYYTTSMNIYFPVLHGSASFQMDVPNSILRWRIEKGRWAPVIASSCWISRWPRNFPREESEKPLSFRVNGNGFGDQPKSTKIVVIFVEDAKHVKIRQDFLKALAGVGHTSHSL